MQDDLAGMFADINDDANTVDAASALVKAEHITLTDVRTGEVVATCEDKDAITSLVSGFDFPARQSAEKPSEAIEHTASFQQRATAKLGESAETAEEVELRTLTTYEGPDALTLRAGLDEPRFHAPADAAALRFLAQR
ncbi:hypothetical protein [Gordonibacter sp. An230]|uniref:hypothetical protein n=1 Tax=Gordonibacter sp. An230 TaxID=1965592 RepID=UPI0011228D0F|nr:hypothetical protein [Gordonibacter sp. An230]